MSIENIRIVEPSSEAHNHLQKEQERNFKKADKKLENNTQENSQDISERIKKLKEENNGWVG